MSVFLSGLVALFLVLSTPLAYAGVLDDLLRGAQKGGSMRETDSRPLDQKTTISGLKEALSIGTEKAVKSVSRIDGYFGNDLIKILLPEKV